MENNKVYLTLPYPPALNSMYRMGKGNYYASKKSKDYKLAVTGIVLANQLSCYPLSDALSMKVYVYPPDLRKRDIDGILKVLLDSLEKAQVYENDCQIKRLYVEMRQKIGKGSIGIEIEVIDQLT